jgi:hypothetical protein
MAQMMAPATRMTADEFSALEETNLIRELIDGEVIIAYGTDESFASAVLGQDIPVLKLLAQDAA